MTIERIEQLNRIIVDFLRSHMPTIQGIDWNKAIYIDYPRMDATFPRISVSQASHTQDPAGIGELWIGKKGELCRTVYDIDIWVKKGNSLQIDPLPNPPHTGTALRDRLGDEIIQLLMNYKKYFKENYGIIDIEVVSSTTVPYMDVYEIFRRTITVRFTYFRSKEDKE